MTPGGERSGAGGRTCRARPGGKGLGGNCLGQLVWVWVGLAWARYFALSLPTAAAAAAAGEAPVARVGFFPRLRGVLGVAAWPAEAVARPAGAAVATPRAPSSFSSAAVAAAGEVPVARAGSVPPLSRRAGGRGVVGPGGGAARRGRGRNPSRALLALLCGCGSLLRCARLLRRGYPPCRRRAGGRGRGRGVARWGCGLRFLRVRGPLPGRGGGACCLGGGGGHLGWPRLPGRRRPPTSTAASASLRSSRSARVSPVHSGEAGERERDRRWGRSSRWGEPSESAITVILVGMRGGRRALPTTSWCISAVPWAVPCGALRGGGGEGVGGRLWCQPRTAGGRRPSIGIGRGGGGATRPTRRAIAPSLGRGPGPWAPGGR